MKANEYLHSKWTHNSSQGFVGVKVLTVRETIFLFMKRVNNNFCHLDTRNARADWATDQTDPLNRIYTDLRNPWLTVFPDRAEAGVPQSLIERGNISFEKLGAARFQRGPGGVELFQTVE